MCHYVIVSRCISWCELVSNLSLKMCVRWPVQCSVGLDLRKYNDVVWHWFRENNTKTKLQAQYHKTKDISQHTSFSAAETLIESIACVLVCCIINYATSADASVFMSCTFGSSIYGLCQLSLHSREGVNPSGMEEGVHSDHISVWKFPQLLVGGRGLEGCCWLISL